MKSKDIVALGVVLALLVVVSCERTRHHHKRMQFNLKKAGLGQKEVTVTTNIIKKSKAFLDKQEAEAEPANAIHKEAPAGRWTDEKALLSSGQLYVRIIQKGVEDDNMSQFSKLEYKLSESMLFFMTVDNDYRGVQYGLNLIDVPLKSDKLAIGDCCGRIEPQVKHVEIELYQFTGYCFRIDMPHSNWLLCDEDMQSLSQFRELLVRSIIAAWYKINMPGLQPPTGISANDCTKIPFNWAPGSQSLWPCKCAKKKFTQQSPLAIEESMTVNVEDTALNLKLGNTYSIRYGLVIREPEFYGEFGTFTYVTAKSKEVYNIFKFSFKIGKAEHPITKDGVAVNQVVSELHVHGKDLSGKYGILAIQLIVGKENKFVRQLNVQGWDFTKSFQSEDDMAGLICLKGEGYKWRPTNFELDQVLNGDDSHTFSFFRYIGSLTKPPCDEGINWFVLSNPSQISSAQLSQLKTYGLTKAKISPNNVRMPQPPGDRKVESQISPPCPPLPPKKIEPPNDDYKYIRASHTTVISGMAGAKATIKSVFEDHQDTDPQDPNQITLSEDLKLKQLFPGEDHSLPKEITPEVQQILIKKFLAQKGVLGEEDRETLEKAKPEQ